MTNMLFILSRTFDHSELYVNRKKKIGLADEIFDESLMHIDDTIRYSTIHAFRNEEFFNELPPKIRSRLVKIVLKK